MEIKKTVLATAVLFACTFSVATAQRKKVRELEDKTYTVTLYDKKNTKKGNPDEVVIKADKIKSNFIDDKFGFGPFQIEITKDSTFWDEELEVRVVSIEAEGSNSKGEYIKWKVKIDGYDIEGEAVISKNDKIKREFEFSGSEKVKKKKR